MLLRLNAVGANLVPKLATPRRMIEKAGHSKFLILLSHGSSWVLVDLL